jgi:hypothetical protein
VGSNLCFPISRWKCVVVMHDSCLWHFPRPFPGNNCVHISDLKDAIVLCIKCNSSVFQNYLWMLRIFAFVSCWLYVSLWSVCHLLTAFGKLAVPIIHLPVIKSFPHILHLTCGELQLVTLALSPEVGWYSAVLHLAFQSMTSSNTNSNVRTRRLRLCFGQW